MAGKARAKSNAPISSSGFIGNFKRRLELERERDKHKSAMIPLIEVLKNKKILDVSGFQDSKISHAIHDTIDHAWLFWMLKERGLFEKYLGLFDAIGNPEATDIYKREGEVVASIGFGVRYWANIEAGFIPKVSITELAERFEIYFDQGELDDLHLDSYRKVRELVKHPMQREAQSLAFVFSASRCSTPKRCCSSTTIKPRSLNCTFWLNNA